MSNYNTDGDGITWNCYGATPTMANATTKCQWGSPTATRTILVTGDSQSAMWLEAIDWLGHVLNWKVVLFAHVGCAPWIDPNAVDFQGNPTTECRAFRTSVASIISQLKPQVIIPVGQAGTYGRGKYPSVAQLEGEMSAFVSEATAVKARIVMLTQIPQYLPGVVSADPNTCLSRRNGQYQEGGAHQYHATVLHHRKMRTLRELPKRGSSGLLRQRPHELSLHGLDPGRVRGTRPTHP